MNTEKIEDLVAEELAIKGENDFVRDAYKYRMNCFEVLNWYRNLYYKESDSTERGLMASSINSAFIILSENPQFNQLIKDKNKR